MRALVAVVVTLLLGACGGGGGGVGVDPTGAAPLTVSSTAFDDGGSVPARFTCDGADEVPPLSWSEVPDGAEQIVVTMSDPDAPGGSFVHWLAVLPADTGGIAAGSVSEAAVQGSNGFGTTGYRGPCPPEGDEPHRYVLRVHAVGSSLDLEPGFSSGDLEAALEGEILATGRLTVTYGR